MSDEETQGKERDLGKRIASLIHSIGHWPKKQISGEELEKLKAAMDRLDQMLKDAADADRQALREAAGRLSAAAVRVTFKS